MTRSSVLLSRLWFALVVLRFVGSAGDVAAKVVDSTRTPIQVILNPTTTPAISVALTWRTEGPAPDQAVQFAVATPGTSFTAQAISVPRAERDGDLGYTRRGLLPFRRSLRAETGHALSLSGRERGRMDGVEPGPDRPNGSGSVYLRLLRRPPGWLEGTRHSNLSDRRPARAGRRLLADRGRSDLRTRGRPDPRLLHRRRCRLPQPPRGAGCRQPRHRVSVRRGRQHRSQQEGQESSGARNCRPPGAPNSPCRRMGSRGSRSPTTTSTTRECD
jgi:hypothetical protein